jgi:hypothetical protein
MQQRQLRLGDVVDDYCPRERRLTNHAVVAIVGDKVKQTRCSTCDAEHEYKHGQIPRQRRKESPTDVSSLPASLPKRVVPGVGHSGAPAESSSGSGGTSAAEHERDSDVPAMATDAIDDPESIRPQAVTAAETEGPAHRRLIRATLPRTEGQAPPQRAAPDFTIRQPAGGRPNRFRPRPQHSAGPLEGNRPGPFGGGGQAPRGGGARPDSRTHGGPRQGRRSDGGHKRSK